MELNKYQTPIEELKYTHVDENTGEQSYFSWQDCPEEIREEFNEAISVYSVAYQQRQATLQRLAER